MVHTCSTIVSTARMINKNFTNNHVIFIHLLLNFGLIFTAGTALLRKKKLINRQASGIRIKIAISNKLLEYNFTGTSKQKFNATILAKTVMDNNAPKVVVLLNNKRKPPSASAIPVNILYAVE